MNGEAIRNHNPCDHCQGLGYIEIRDCAGEIQREQTCFFCGGLGYIEEKEEEPSSPHNSQALPDSLSCFSKSIS